MGDLTPFISQNDNRYDENTEYLTIKSLILTFKETKYRAAIFRDKVK